MFYPVESLKRGGRFYLCWVADSWPLRFNNVAHKQLWSQDVRKLCDDLLEVMTNESGSPSNRFSLRLSSQLTRGLVRLYQRKVNILLGEVCMINANVMRQSHKKFNKQEKSPVQHRLPRVKVIVPQENENISLKVLEELLQNSGNLVANIQEITLKEATIPEHQTTNEGFGEENVLQQIQQLTDMSVEYMLQDPNQQQQTSGFEGSALDVAEKSHDKSRLVVEQHMERISDLDLTLFRKSTEADLLPPIEPEKDIPDIPEIQQIPPPEPSVLETEKQTAEAQIEVAPAEVPPVLIAENAEEQLQLEELEEGEPQRKRRRRRRGVIIDRTTVLSSNFLRARIDNINVELRCQEASDDIVDIQVPADVYFRRPCHSGSKFQSSLGIPLWELFQRKLDAVPRTPVVERETEELLHQSPRRITKSLLDNIPEEEEQINTIIPEIPQAVDHIIPRISGPHLHVFERDLNVSVPQMQVEQMDISALLTQKVQTISQAKRVSEYDRSPKKRNMGVISFSSFLQSNQVVVVAEVHIEPEKEIQPIEEPPEIKKDTEQGVSVMLQQVGLADLQQKTIEPADQVDLSQKQTEKQRRRRSESSETPLGSLDRTKVSLGDSEKTTDSKRFIRNQWGTEGTMIKILQCIKKGVHPLTPRKLVSKGPVISEYKRIILARCFFSILKLKQHGFIRVTKVPVTQEIQDITLGAKFD